MPTTRPDTLDRQAGGILDACAEGRLSPPLALTRLLLLAPEPGLVRGWLARHGTHRAVPALRDLLERHAEGANRTAAVLRLAARHAAPDVEGCARLFDQAVAASPEAAVAAYSLGDPDLLAAATAELVGLLERLGLLGADRRLLDIGCGIGRLEQALAGRVARITGVDVSPGMVREARARCAGLGGVEILPTSGRDLAPLPDRSFDAAIAIDTFPYLFQAGGMELVRVQLEEIARVLRPTGDLVVLNLSYRGDLERDRAEATALAAATGFALLRAGTADLRLWDGRTFHFRKG